ncbi:Outer membrane protein OmpA [Allochromatium warmingii]|uniref:Outer membrane protein OmpA n=1 Tax=Allochromatium warmingii TaxID=61595 RepID=A0A1H3JIA8_ALLWA|nr:OmpA family protein [Allochromatium warmingii]SDY39703.1 Outer membrane protein OmpA [Allochromatium warmingii]
MTVHAFRNYRLCSIAQRLGLLWVLWAWLHSATVLAAPGYEQDLHGAADLPGIARFAGTVIIGYRVSEFDETLIPIGPWDDGASSEGWTKTLKVVGRRTRIIYLAPRDVTAQAVIQHYQDTLTQQGYQPFYQCAGFDTCGEKIDRFYSEPSYGKQLTERYVLKYVYSDSTVQDPYLYSAQRQDEAGATSLFIFAARQDNFADSAAGNRVAIFVEAVIGQPIRESITPLPASELAQGLTEAGRIAVPGIQFNTDPITIRPESQPQLEQIALLLVEQPALKLYIVGHTDNRGSLDENLELSRRRAQEVVRTLIQSFGIFGERLKAMGVANLAPLTTNANAAGQALNQRIELVAQ